jgi:hypothetical protein
MRASIYFSFVIALKLISWCFVFVCLAGDENDPRNHTHDTNKHATPNEKLNDQMRNEKWKVEGE